MFLEISVVQKVMSYRQQNSDAKVAFFSETIFPRILKKRRIAKVPAFFSLFIDAHARKGRYKMLAYFNICLLFAKYLAK
jgi:hypothetical protein